MNREWGLKGVSRYGYNWRKKTGKMCQKMKNQKIDKQKTENQKLENEEWKALQDGLHLKNWENASENRKSEIRKSKNSK